MIHVIKKVAGFSWFDYNIAFSNARFRELLMIVIEDIYFLRKMEL